MDSKVVMGRKNITTRDKKIMGLCYGSIGICSRQKNIFTKKED